MLDLFIRDYIKVWYEPINFSKSKEVERNVRSSLNGIVMNAIEYFKFISNSNKNGDSLMMITYGIANSLIVHLREFRLFKNSKKSVEYYVMSNKDKTSVFSTEELSNETLTQRLSNLAQFLLKRLVPSVDQGSIIMMSILREIVSTSLLLPLVDHFSNPDTLNQVFIDLLTDVEEDPKESLSGEEEVEDEIDDNIVTGISTLSLLRNSRLLDSFMDYMESISAPPYIRFWTNSVM